MPESKMVRELRVAVFHSPTSAEADLFRRAANQLQRQDDQITALTAERDALQKVIDDFEEALAGATVSLHITDPEDAERLDAAHLALFGEATTDDD